MRILFALLCLSIAHSAFAADSSLKTPNISANTLFLYQNSNFHKDDVDPANPDQNRNGFDIQEAELQFYSDVDPYTRLNMLLSVHPEYESDGTKVEEKWILEPEELFVESTSLPSVLLKLGKFKAAMGKHNMLHTHAYPFIQAPLANQALLGDEGLNDVGLSGAIMLPAPWFSELTLQALRGEGENAEFNSPSPSDGVGLAHWKNLFDLSDALTMELGLSYATGGNSLKGTTALSGADLTFKWRPNEGGRYHSLIWSTEYLARNESQSGVSDNEKSYGVSSFIQYQFAERWAALYRYDNLNVENTFNPATLPNGPSERNSLAIAYMPSEFSSFKLEYDQRHGGVPSSSGEDTEKAIFLQANFTIGSHPAHAY
ncbi:MAG: hypothetical protein JSU04_11460 [Bdellovibrionales bacterium]|nr:hypothetical protein [Bdellovibrionales bacterium]